MIILGIETSCDETAISVIEAEGDLENPRFKLLGSALHSQVETHKEFGGVVPMLAKREHIKNLPIVLGKAFSEAKLNSVKLINLIAVTMGPGLEPALWTGIKFAEELSGKWGVSVIPTNHMIGHITSVLFNNTKVEFPALALLISGGHTELVMLKSWGEMEKIGETQDDAVGEAYDKVARMLGLPYPGGPEISALAEKARNSKHEILHVRLPRPMIHSKDFNFSFSGLKTSVLYYLRDQTSPPHFVWPLPLARGGVRGEVIPEILKLQIAQEFEEAVTETLVSKTKKALDQYHPKTLIIGGGVIANTYLRENFLNLKKDYSDLKIMIPEKSLTTDNATMIAAAGYIEYLKNGDKKREMKADGNLDIS